MPYFALIVALGQPSSSALSVESSDNDELLEAALGGNTLEPDSPMDLEEDEPPSSSPAVDLMGKLRSFI